MSYREQAENEGIYGSTGWMIGDIKGKLPHLTDEEAEEWLLTHEEKLRDAMVRAGWEAIDAIIAWDLD